MADPDEINYKVSNNNLTRTFRRNEGGFQEVFYTQPQGLRAKNQLLEFMRDGANSKDMETAAGTLGTPVNFEYEVPAGEMAHVSMVEFIILDAGIQPRRFGGDNELTNGLLVQAIASDGSTVLKDFLDGEAIKTNTDFSWLAGVNALHDDSGFDMFVARWTLRDFSGELVLDEGQRLRISVRDDITGLESMVSVVKGSRFNK